MDKKRILLVEDDGVIRSAISDYLRREGYAVEEAGDGLQALEVFGTGTFDLVITDIAMRRLHGLELVERVQRLSPALPMIVITGYMSRSTGKAILKEKAVFLRKPFKLEQLSSTVKSLLGEPL
jgi:DNA-binding NtrC family response regulator